jgi:hypothetical protein
LIAEHAEKIDSNLPDQMQQTGRTAEDLFRHGFVDYSAALHMERASRSIFGSQLDAIGFLSGVGGQSTLDQIRSYYDQAAGKWPTEYQIYPFERWLEFLTSRGLIEVAADIVKLRPAGKAILPYMQSQGYLATRPFG